MKCYSTKIQNAKANADYQERRKKRQEYLDSLTPEERQKYFENEKKSSDKAKKLVAQLATLSVMLGDNYNK